MGSVLSSYWTSFLPFVLFFSLGEEAPLLNCGARFLTCSEWGTGFAVAFPFLDHHKGSSSGDSIAHKVDSRLLHKAIITPRSHPFHPLIKLKIRGSVDMYYVCTDFDQPHVG